MNFYLAGLDNGLAQLEFIGGSYDFNRLWITSGVSNLGCPWPSSSASATQ
jgi:hypothetical protein